MYGSASKGCNGTLYPAYHCNKGHYFRVPKAKLEASVIEFVKHISLTQEHVELITQTVMIEWERRHEHLMADLRRYDEQIKQLELEMEATARKFKMVESATAIKYMEADLIKIEGKIDQLKIEKQEKMAEEQVDISKAMPRVKYFLENLDKLLVQQIDPVKKAQFFGVFFDRIPTYEEIKSRTKNSAILPGVNALFQVVTTSVPGLVAPPRLELGTHGASIRCSTN